MDPAHIVAITVSPLSLICLSVACCTHSWHHLKDNTTTCWGSGGHYPAILGIKFFVDLAIVLFASGVILVDDLHRLPRIEVFNSFIVCSYTVSLFLESMFLYTRYYDTNSLAKKLCIRDFGAVFLLFCPWGISWVLLALGATIVVLGLDGRAGFKLDWSAILAIDLGVVLLKFGFDVFCSIRFFWVIRKSFKRALTDRVYADQIRGIAYNVILGLASSFISCTTLFILLLLHDPIVTWICLPLACWSNTLTLAMCFQKNRTWLPRYLFWLGTCGYEFWGRSGSGRFCRCEKDGKVITHEDVRHGRQIATLSEVPNLTLDIIMESGSDLTNRPSIESKPDRSTFSSGSDSSFLTPTSPRNRALTDLGPQEKKFIHENTELPQLNSQTSNSVGSEIRGTLDDFRTHQRTRSRTSSVRSGSAMIVRSKKTTKQFVDFWLDNGMIWGDAQEIVRDVEENSGGVTPS